MSKPVLTLKFGRGFYFPKGKESEAMFEHILPQTEYHTHRHCTDDIDTIKLMAKLHGWNVKVVQATDDDFEDEC